MDLWTSWNLDPWLVAALGLILVAYVGLYGQHVHAKDTRLFAGGWLILALIFLSPLCALTSALFSARVAHHLVMIGIATPLLTLSLPCRKPFLPVGAAALLQALVLWFWHAPAPYTAALTSDGLFWAMQLTLLGSAWAFWQGVFSPRSAPVSVLIALLGTIVQMGLLGALITFAPVPLYPPHLLTTGPWSMSALEDQQLAGLIMWIPSVAPYLVAALVLIGRSLDRTVQVDGSQQ
jgi:putative membrane protein